MIMHYIESCWIKIKALKALVWHFSRQPTEGINSLPNNQILGWAKLKAFANNKINVTEILKFALERVENIMGKGENPGYQHVLLLPQCFQKVFQGIVW